MLHEKVLLTNLQVHCPSREPEINKVAGQLRNSFYAASLPWCEGNLGRVIPRNQFDAFHEEYQELRNQFKTLIPAETTGHGVTLVHIPFPVLISGKREKEATQILSQALEERFERRVRMLRDALVEEKRFYQSLLTELKAVVRVGLYLNQDIDPKLLKRIKRADFELLCFSAEAIRRSTSLKKDIITICGALL